MVLEWDGEYGWGSECSVGGRRVEEDGMVGIRAWCLPETFAFALKVPKGRH